MRDRKHQLYEPQAERRLLPREPCRAQAAIRHLGAARKDKPKHFPTQEAVLLMRDNVHDWDTGAWGHIRAPMMYLFP